MISDQLSLSVSMKFEVSHGTNKLNKNVKYLSKATTLVSIQAQQ